MVYSIAIDIDKLELEDIHEDYVNMFVQIVLDWYKRDSKVFHLDIPNTDELFKESGQYADMLFDPIAFTICDANELEGDDQFTRAYEIISDGFESFLESVVKNVFKVLNHSQLFYARGYVTVSSDEDEKIYWENKECINQPIQEVW